MLNGKKKIIYGILIIVLNAAILSVEIINVVNWMAKKSIIFLFVFSNCLWFVSLMALVLHIGIIFDWFYTKMASSVDNARPEFFSTSQFLLPKNKAYRRLKYITVVLLVIAITLQLILLFVK